MAHEISPFLMFEGQAEEAMNFYVTLFENSRIERITRYSAGMPGPEGTIVTASFTLGGRKFLCSDSYVNHAFGFTPSISIFVECASEAEIETSYARLMEGGEALMEIGNYGFSQRFGWVRDRFGVTWQLNLV